MTELDLGAEDRKQEAAQPPAAAPKAAAPESSGGLDFDFNLDADKPAGDAKSAMPPEPSKVDLSEISLDLGSDATVMAPKASGDPKWQEVATKLDLWSSTTHAATKSIEYYDQVAGLMHGGANDRGDIYGKTREFFRLFMVPSASGSKGPDTYDSMPYLEQWVEQGKPPASIVASHFTSGVVDRTRPVCAYPDRAVYTGSGSTDSADSFVCRRLH